jgi:Family of unknown function (DUF6510)
MDALKLDGNAAAGALQEVFALEMTAASGTCDSCGAVGAVGELMLYVHAPGLVFRCPHCDAVVLRMVTDGTRYWIDVRGLRSLVLTSA